MIPAGQILCTYRAPFDLTPAVAFLPPKTTLEEAVKRFVALPPDFADHGVICINGAPVPREAWGRIRTRAPQPGRVIELSFHQAPRGGRGGRGKMIFALIASFALTFAAGWIAKGGLAAKFGLTRFAAGTAGAYIAAAGVQIIGSLLIQSLIAPPQTAASKQAKFRNDGASSAEGNVLEPNGALPRIVGERKVFPPLGLEPYTYFDGADEVVEAVYVLGGPHRLQDIRIGAASAADLPGCEIETREGWPGDAPLTLIRRQTRTEAPQAELRGHTVDGDDQARLDTTIEVADALPQAQVVSTRDAPDEHQLHLIFPQGLHYEGGNTRMRVPVRLRMRPRGGTTWRNLPELHFQGASLRQLRATIRLVWTTAALAPAAPSSPATDGWIEARRASADQTASPAGGGWTADPTFGTAGAVWMATDNLDSTGVTNCALTRYEARIHLHPDDWPRGQWEIEITRGCTVASGDYSSSAYTVGGSVWSLFGYRDPAAPTIARSRDKLADSLVLLRSVSIWSAAPVIPGDMAMIAIRARNRQLDRLSVLAGGYVPDWDGTDWRAWTVTSNPAPHLRDILAGRLNADALPADMLDNDNLLDFLAHCTAQGYTVNALLEGQSVAQAAEIVAACGYARPYMSDRWGVVMDRDRSADAPVQVFTPRNMRSFAWRRAMPRQADGLRVTFRDSARDYEARQITVLRAGGQDNGLLEQVEYEGLVTEAAVRARAAYDLAQLELRSVDYTLDAPAEAIVCRKGSLVAVQHDTIGGNSASARIATVWVDEAGDVVALELDTEVPVVTRPGFPDIAAMSAVPDMSLIGARSAALIRRTTGEITLHPITGDDAGTATIEFDTPIDPDGVAPDGLVVVGTRDRHHLRAIVKDMTPKEDFVMSLTLVDEAPELHHG